MTILAPAANISPALETERQLKINAAICRRGRERTAGRGIGLAKERRTQVTDRWGQVHIVQDVPGGSAQGKGVLSVHVVSRAPESPPATT